MPLLEQLSGCTMPYFYLHVGELWPQCLDKSQCLLHVLMQIISCLNKVLACINRSSKLNV